MGKTIPLSKVVDQSVLFSKTLTVPNNYWKYWKSVPDNHSESIKIKIIWKDKNKKEIQGSGTIKRTHKKGVKPQEYVLITWDNIIHKNIYNCFCYSYMILYGYRFSDKKDNSKSINILNNGQELFEIYEIDKNIFSFEPKITIYNEFSEIFEKLADRDIFNIWDDSSNDNKPSPFIEYSSDWYKISQLKKHSYRENVIYYLIDSKNKQFYVGKADKLGSRVEPNRPEIKGWDYFRYDVIKPEAKHFILRLEDMLIRSFAKCMKNKKILNEQNISSWELQNKQWKDV